LKSEIKRIIIRIVKIFGYKLVSLKSGIKKTNKILDREYSFGNYKIILKGNHVLAKYQESFPLYDRFLPILCADFDGLIIDIGANIGDTSIAIFSKNPKAFIVGVEPDTGFYDECINNIKLNDLSDRFLGIKKFVSTKIGTYSLEKSKTSSTGSILYDSKQTGEINTISFTQLMDLIPSTRKMKFDILKIDTDGFDWDILDSFINYSQNSLIKPRFVFFEMQTYLNNTGVKDINRNQIIENYKLSIERLHSIGYINFCLLDNFGTPIKITQSLSEIFEINDYIKRSQIYNSYSTIYYMDVLAFSDDEIVYVNQAISNLYNDIE
jgi:FkbM family methyltransferase